MNSSVNPLVIDFDSDLTEEQKKLLRQLLDEAEESFNSQAKREMTKDSLTLPLSIKDYKANDERFITDKDGNMKWFKPTHKLILRRRGNNKPGFVFEVVSTEEVGKGSFGKTLNLIGKIKKEGDDSVEFIKYGCDTSNAYLVKEVSIRQQDDREGFQHESKILSLADSLCPKPSSCNTVTGFLFMLKLPGVDLIKAHDKINIDKAASGEFILRSLTTLALAYQQQLQNKIIHNDIKVENIKVEIINNQLWKAIIFDFGMSAKATDANPEARGGTLAYESPELIDPKNNISSIKSDMYSLGVTFGVFICNILKLQNFADELFTWELKFNSLFKHNHPLADTQQKFREFLLKSIKRAITNTDLPKDKINDLIALMLDDNPKNRPDPDAILNTLQQLQKTLIDQRQAKFYDDALKARIALQDLSEKAKQDFSNSSKLDRYLDQVNPHLESLQKIIDTLPNFPAEQLQDTIEQLRVKSFVSLKDAQAMKEFTQRTILEFQSHIEELKILTLTAKKADKAEKDRLNAELQDIFSKVNKKNLTIDDLVYLNSRFAFRINKLVLKPANQNLNLSELLRAEQQRLLEKIEEAAKEAQTPTELQLGAQAIIAAKEFVQDPNASNIYRLRELARKAYASPRLRQMATGLMLLGGFTLICLSITLAVSTFGAGAPVSALGSTLGITMMASAVTGVSVSVIGGSLFKKATATNSEVTNDKVIKPGSIAKA